MKTKNITHWIFATILTIFYLHTNAQWIQVNTGTTVELQDIYFPTVDTGYVVGYNGVILKTINNGNNWITLNSITTSNLYAVSFLTANKGFVVGDSGMFKTANGGMNWNKLILPTNEALRDIKFFNSQIGFAVGKNGTILKTTDGGNNWVSKLTNTTLTLSAVHFPVSDTGYVVSSDRTYGAFLKTVDGGENWDSLDLNPSITQASLEDVYFKDANTGYFVGWYIGTFINTNNSWGAWFNVSILDTLADPNLNAICFPSTNFGYAVGYGGEIYKTMDGQNWKRSVFGNGGNIFYDVYFTNDTTGYIVGDGGILLKTSNGGTTEVNSINNNSLVIAVYPNPTNSNFFVEYELRNTENINIVITDMLGRQVSVTESNNQSSGQYKKEINIDLPNGMYNIALKTQNTLTNKKLIISATP